MDEITRYRTSQVAEIFLVKSWSVIRWANRFFDQLDAGAHPNQGKQRYFTDLDVRKLALIKKMQDEDKSEDEIRVRLINGEVETPPDSVSALAYLDSKNIPVHMQKHVAMLESELARIKIENEELKNAKLQSDTLLKEVRERLVAKEAELVKAYKVIGRLEGE